MILAALCENPSITNDIFSLTFIINVTQAIHIIMQLQIWSVYFSYSNHYLSVSCIHLQILSFMENSREVESSIVFGQKCNQSPLTLSIVKTLQAICWHFSSIFFFVIFNFLRFLTTCWLGKCQHPHPSAGGSVGILEQISKITKVLDSNYLKERICTRAFYHQKCELQRGQ